MEEKIFITMEEYKELLIIKGKYEELKSQQVEKNKPQYPLYREFIDENIMLCKGSKGISKGDKGIIDQI